MNFLFKKQKPIRIIQIMLTLLLGGLSFTASDCEKILNSSGNVPQQMIGNWKLVEQTGSLIDICDDETINFQASGVAVLTCPNSSAISRDFTVVNDVLTYTQTTIAYTIQTLTNDSLSLVGQNVSRNLIYLKINVDIPSVINDKVPNLNNSSEVRKEK